MTAHPPAQEPSGPAARSGPGAPPGPTTAGRPAAAGVVTAVVGFASSFAVVLAGLGAVGASPAEAASGLLALCVAQGLGILWLVRRHRVPVTLAWSTPGAALLVTTGAVAGGWPAAVGAFLVVAALLLLTALWPALGRLVATIPAPLAQAMLAGVLLTLCLAPVLALARTPLLAAPAVVVWLVLLRRSPRWAAPAALAVTLVVLVVLVVPVVPGGGPTAGDLLPQVRPTTPALSWQAVVGVALPLYVVTMASQNVPGVAVLASFGYRVPWRESLTVTGVGTALAAPFGGHAVNLAAISAALAAGPEAGPDPTERWRAARAAGWTYLVLGVLSAPLAALVADAPAGLVESAAGLALLPTLGAALAAALAPGPAAGAGRPTPPVAAVVTLVVAASGVVVGGVGAPFWALVAGLGTALLLRPRRPAPPGLSRTSP